MYYIKDGKVVKLVPMSMQKKEKTEIKENFCNCSKGKVLMYILYALIVVLIGYLIYLVFFQKEQRLSAIPRLSPPMQRNVATPMARTF